MKMFLLPQPLGNAILQYLGRQPFVEVAGMIKALDQLQEAPPLPLAIVPKEGEPKA